MEQHRVVLEYRAILDELKLLPGSQAVESVLRKLEMGWLTPGSEILARIENQELPVQKILRHSRSLIRKWFNDLNDEQKGRWVMLFRLVCVDEELQEIVQLSLRRLQQLQKLAK